MKLTAHHVSEPSITRLGETVLLETEVDGRYWSVEAPSEAQAKHELELYLLRNS